MTTERDEIRAPPDEPTMAHLRALFRDAGRAEQEGRFADAERLLRERIRLAPWDPIAKSGLSQLLLSRGEYKEGFALYEARSEAPQFAGSVRKPVYRPKPVPFAEAGISAEDAARIVVVEAPARAR